MPFLWSQWLWPILLFVFGLGLVVFVHELGHFLVAKAAGITVERFALGFGPRLFGVSAAGPTTASTCCRWAGTSRCSGRRTSRRRPQTTDPGAFNNKSVGVRLAVVAAGVVMNVLLAGGLFVLVAMVGKEYPAPVVGSVMAGFPASQAQIHWLDEPTATSSAAAPAQAQTAPAEQARGLHPGDRIVSITDGHSLLCLLSQPVTRFADIRWWRCWPRVTAPTNSPSSAPKAGTRAPARSAWASSAPRRSQYAFGIGAAGDTVFGEYEDLVTAGPFRDGDRVLAINGRAVEHSWDVQAHRADADRRPGHRHACCAASGPSTSRSSPQLHLPRRRAVVEGRLAPPRADGPLPIARRTA